MNTDITRMQLTLDTFAANSGSNNKRSTNSWFEAMADAWGQALDEQAARIQTKSLSIGDGFETPAQVSELTAESLRMGYIANSSHTALTAVGSALETLARKQ